MITALSGTRQSGSAVIGWILVATLTGLAIVFLPPGSAVIAVLGMAVAVASLIDRRVALISMLAIAPFKALTETEIPFFKSLPVDIGQIAFFVFVAIWIMQPIAARTEVRLRWTPVLLPLVILLMTTGLSLFSTVNLWNTIKELAGWIEVVILVIIVTVMTLEGQIGAILSGVILSGVIQSLIGIYQFLGGSGAPHLWILDFRYFRAFGTFGQPNPFGAFTGLTLALTVGLLIAALGDVIRQVAARRSLRPLFTSQQLPFGLLLVSTIALAGGLLVSWSRGAWIGFAAAAVVMVMFAPRRRAVGFGIAIIALAGGILAFSVGLVPASLAARITDFAQDFTGFDDIRGQVVNDANYAVMERLAHWQAAVGMMNDHPWLGVGFGAYESAYPQYALMNWPLALGHAHNYYLNLLAETGVIGFSGYAIAWLMILGLTLRALNRHIGLRRGIALGLLGVWAHLLTHSLFDKLYVNNISLTIGVMLGLIGGLLITGRKVTPFFPFTLEGEPPYTEPVSS